MKCLAALACALASASGIAAESAPTQAQRAEARQMYADVVAFKTSVGLAQVPVMAGYLADKLRAVGIPEEDIHILPLGETASFVARYRGDGTGGRPVLLTAHMDVVTANPDEWERDPFTLIEEEGYFFGRGTSDIKADVVAITSTFMRLKREGFVPTRDLIIAFTGDEETDQATTRDLVDNHRALIDAEFALNGDGGGGLLDEETGNALMYSLQGAEKSYATFTFTARNPGGHSSAPRLDNAIYDLADALTKLRAHRFKVMWNDWTIGSFRAAGAATPGALGDAMRRFAENPTDAEAAEVLSREPGYVGRTRTTCVATMLGGGHAENALPQTATATVNCRIFPGTTTEEVRTELQSVAGDSVAVTLTGRAFDSVASPLREDVLLAVTQAVQGIHPGVAIVPDQASYYTDGSIFRAAGIPTYGVSGIFMKESDAFAHGLNERVSVEAFYDALEHWHALIDSIAGR
jgi:acetylornithine deacetylase/succinyl-diaminopimelate desuccinylase-like protein